MPNTNSSATEPAPVAVTSSRTDTTSLVAAVAALSGVVVLLLAIAAAYCVLRRHRKSRSQPTRLAHSQTREPDQSQVRYAYGFAEDEGSASNYQYIETVRTAVTDASGSYDYMSVSDVPSGPNHNKIMVEPVSSARASTVSMMRMVDNDLYSSQHKTDPIRETATTTTQQEHDKDHDLQNGSVQSQADGQRADDQDGSEGCVAEYSLYAGTK